MLKLSDALCGAQAPILIRTSMNDINDLAEPFECEGGCEKREVRGSVVPRSAIISD